MIRNVASLAHAFTEVRLARETKMWHEEVLVVSQDIITVQRSFLALTYSDSIELFVSIGRVS